MIPRGRCIQRGHRGEMVVLIGLAPELPTIDTEVALGRIRGRGIELLGPDQVLA